MYSVSLSDHNATTPTMYHHEKSACHCGDSENVEGKNWEAGDRALFERLWKGTFRAILAEREAQREIASLRAAARSRRLGRHSCCCCHHPVVSPAVANLKIRVLGPPRSQSSIASSRTLRSVVR
jgi:hypothetical protein